MHTVDSSTKKRARKVVPTKSVQTRRAIRLDAVHNAVFSNDFLVSRFVRHLEPLQLLLAGQVAKQWARLCNDPALWQQVWPWWQATSQLTDRLGHKQLFIKMQKAAHKEPRRCLRRKDVSLLVRISNDAGDTLICNELPFPLRQADLPRPNFNAGSLRWELVRSGLLDVTRLRSELVWGWDGEERCFMRERAEDYMEHNFSSEYNGTSCEEEDRRVHEAWGSVCVHAFRRDTNQVCELLPEGSSLSYGVFGDEEEEDESAKERYEGAICTGFAVGIFLNMSALNLDSEPPSVGEMWFEIGHRLTQDRGWDGEAIEIADELLEVLSLQEWT